MAQVVARQGLALRGDWTDEDGNLIQFLKMRAEDVPELARWLKRESYKWLSHAVVNEILSMMTETVYCGQYSKKLEPTIFFH